MPESVNCAPSCWEKLPARNSFGTVVSVALFELGRYANPVQSTKKKVLSRPL